MPVYTVEDSQSGKKIKFEWYGKKPPADSDMEEIFKQSGGGGEIPAVPPSSEAPEWAGKHPTLYGIKGAAKGVLRGAAVGASGFNKGVAGGVGIPVDIINTALGVVGLGSDTPVAGSKWIQENIMPAPIEAETVPEHILGAVGEQLGAAAVPLAGILGYVAKTRKVTAPVVKALLGNLEKMPLSELLKVEALMAVSMGTASGVTRSVTDNPYADMAAQLMAGLGTAGAMSVVGAFKKHLTAAGQTHKAGKALKESAPDMDRFQKNLGEAQAIEEKLGGDKLFTTAQATNTPSLIGTENAIIRTGDKSSEEFMQRVLNREARANKAIGQFGDNILPKGSIEDTKSALLQAENEAAAYSRNVTDKYLNIDKQSTGQTLYDILSDAKSAKYEEVSGLFDDIGEINPTVKPDELRRTLRNASSPRAPGGSTASVPSEQIGRMNQFIEPSAEVKGILALPKAQRDALLEQHPDLAKKVAEEIAKEVPFDTLRAWRQEIGQAIRNEQKVISPDGDKIMRLKDIGNTVDEMLDSIGARGDDVGEQYQIAKQRYKDEYVPYKQGAAADIRRRGARGEITKIAPENMAARFFKSGDGSIRATQDFIQTMGNKPAAVKALREAVINDAVESTIDPGTGLVSAKKLGMWLKEHRDALNAFPEIKEEVASIRTLQTKIDGIIETSLFVKGDIKRVIPSILNSKNSTQELNKILRVFKDNQKALDGIKKAVWEHMLDVTASKNKDINGIIIRDVNALKSFRKEYGNIFGQLYTPKELKDIDTFTNAYEIMTRTDRNPIKAGSPASTYLNSQEGKTAANIAFFGSRTFGMPYYGSVALAHTTKTIIGIFTKTQREMLINQALLDPKVAETFIKMANNAPVSFVKKAFDTALRNVAVDKAADINQERYKDKRKNLFESRGLGGIE